jgi:hypothetical protein
MKIICDCINKGNDKAQLGAIEMRRQYDNLFTFFKDKLKEALNKQN